MKPEAIFKRYNMHCQQFISLLENIISSSKAIQEIDSLVSKLGFFRVLIRNAIFVKMQHVQETRRFLSPQPS